MHTYLGVDLVETPDAHDEGQLGLALHIEAAVGLGLTLQPDRVTLLGEGREGEESVQRGQGGGGGGVNMGKELTTKIHTDLRTPGSQGGAEVKIRGGGQELLEGMLALLPVSSLD